MVRGRRSALSYGDLGDAEGGATIAMRSRTSNGAPGGRQKQVLMVEVAVERGHCRFIVMLARRI